MNWSSRKNLLSAIFAAAFSVVGTVNGELTQAPVLLPVSNGVLRLGEWNSNFNGALAAADAYNIPLLVFYGGLSCGKCELLQMACLSDEFLAWQRTHGMLMVFTTNNSKGAASGFSKPAEATGFPYMAVYWNRYGYAPQKDSELYRTFNGRDGEMLVKGGSLAAQLIGSIESVVGEYDFTSTPDISARAEMLYSDPVTTKIAYDLKLFVGLNAADALSPQTVYNVRVGSKVVMKKSSGSLPQGVKLVCKDNVLSLSGTARKAGAYTYVVSLQQKINGVLYAGPDITFSFNVVAGNDVSQGGCAMLGNAIKATVPLLSSGDGGTAVGMLEFAATARNRVRAKYSSLQRVRTTFSGAWTDISDGTSFATLASGDRTLSLELASDGRLKAILSDPSLSASIVSPDGVKVGVGGYAAAFVGAYTISLADDSSGGTDGGIIYVKKITSAGRINWGGTLPDGKKVTGTAFAMLGADNSCVVPLFKSAAKNYVSAVLKIYGDQGTVVPYGGTKAIWGDADYPASTHECTVQGGRYEKSANGGVQ